MMKHNLHAPNKFLALTKLQGALLGAAVGDALGWPQEFPKKHVNKKSQKRVPSLEFQRWERKAGGQYYPHIEVIQPGEYSDDTQLLLCTARSLLYSEQWWQHFTQYELPTWIQYERGGGGATLRSVRSWMDGQSPWSNHKLRQQYFNAGGNGVAMRILPHCLLGIFDSDFTTIAHNIIANGVTTHGNPRALVGALAYGFALWIALRQSESLEYGKLIDVLLTDISAWSHLSNIGDFYPDWELAVKSFHHDQYKKQWQLAVNEMQQLLEQSRFGISQGALSIDTEILKQLGCFSREKGLGTITAAAAIFLASRYAADPSHGLLEAAFAHGADTDTLASMTGALLSAISGSEWLDQSAEEVQDAEYLKIIGQKLIQKDLPIPAYRSTQANEMGKASSTEMLKNLEKLQRGAKILLADSREATLLETYLHPSSSNATRAKSWKLLTADGQTLYVKRVWHDKVEAKGEITVISPSESYEVDSVSQSATQPELAGSQTSNHQALSRIDLTVNLLPAKASDSAVKLVVDNLDDSRFFYEKVLGFTCIKESKKLVKYGNIWLIESQKENVTDEIGNSCLVSSTQDANPDVWVEVESFDNVYQNVCLVGLEIVKSISERDASRYFICRDPSRHLILIKEVDF